MPLLHGNQSWQVPQPASARPQALLALPDSLRLSFRLVKSLLHAFKGVTQKRAMLVLLQEALVGAYRKMGLENLWLPDLRYVPGNN